MYFLVLLKRAKFPVLDTVNFYCTCIRSILEYCSPVFHFALPAYLNDDLERVQRRAMSIISPGVSYHQNLELCNLSSLQERRKDQCSKLFHSIASDPTDKLHKLLPPRHEAEYNLRRTHMFDLPHMHMDRFKRTFILAACSSIDF